MIGALVLACGGKGGDSETASASESSSASASSGGATTAGTTSSGSSGGSDTGGGTGSSGGGSSGGGSSSGGTGGTSTGGTGTGGTGTGGTSTGGSSSGGSSGSSGGDLCPDGTCILFDGGPCEEPTGPLGNGCCACGPNDFCSAFCRCAAPDTPIATPSGERAIAGLRPGDLVLSVDAGRVVAVPVLEVSKVPAPAEHAVVRVRLDDGRSIEMSPGHPTAEGRTFGALAPGERLGSATIAGVERVGYAHAFTHDILPDSDSGTYFAAGAWVGSTLRLGPTSLVCE